MLSGVPSPSLPQMSSQAEPSQTPAPRDTGPDSAERFTTADQQAEAQGSPLQKQLAQLAILEGVKPPFVVPGLLPPTSNALLRDAARDGYRAVVQPTGKPPAP